MSCELWRGLSGEGEYVVVVVVDKGKIEAVTMTREEDSVQ